jgi:dTDP-4-dehydrorhamnose 3,5-epimerase-like enzyme
VAYLINLKTIRDPRGALTVIEEVLPFEIKRVFYIYDVKGKRGEHRQLETYQALISLNGSVEVFCDNGKVQKTFLLDAPDKCLLVPPEDWHSMDHFSTGAILLVLASHVYNPQFTMTEKY